MACCHEDTSSNKGLPETAELSVEEEAIFRGALNRMDALIPWDALVEQIRPYYPSSGKGRVPSSLVCSDLPEPLSQLGILLETTLSGWH